jgi:hypothetical protein
LRLAATAMGAITWPDVSFINGSNELDDAQMPTSMRRRRRLSTQNGGARSTQTLLSQASVSRRERITSV